MGGKKTKASQINSGLGKAIIRKRFQGNRPQDGDQKLHTTEVNDGPAWVRLQSITQEGDLDEFLHTAELAGTEFTAERQNVQVIQTDSRSTANPFLLTAEQEEAALARHASLASALTVPRRPPWDETTTAEQLQLAERESFLAWRRGLAALQEEEGLLLTPFERNLEVWRQLWRTLPLTDTVLLCDCPGLVFPSFATTQGEMVCNGVLPIDQMREYTAPTSLVAQRIPRPLQESIYGINVKIYDETEQGRVIPTGEELCKAYALARGFMRSGQGNPDESRAARYILKDYVRGKLVFVHPPPTYEGTPTEFNADLHDKVLALCNKRPPPPLQRPKQQLALQRAATGSRSQNVDHEFFDQASVKAHVKGVRGTADYARSSMGRALALGGGPGTGGPGKKTHKKGKKNQKLRIPVRDE
ncbi:hypothetical protein AMAG_16450 [Allomyces macrogynus ATCC 38327]|uniref:Large subunit GTPase 1 n=1 Tax=Allomyces macrogynus (strain ATCC 38327) TaxID=578462 RepID=A0A0L0TD76_ALLM3|nr:hypothetical protein AMAG_16450 [Allomyces macrogynus ATCC 38327]|eukprot:KNE72692.1 hypothetical protein AMAG_16450 [Allomyces macrogynus ATCC 38327]